MSPDVGTPTMYCRKCRYVLDGLTEHRCPECGMAIPTPEQSSE